MFRTSALFVGYPHVASAVVIGKMHAVSHSLIRAFLSFSALYQAWYSTRVVRVNLSCACWVVPLAYR